MRAGTAWLMWSIPAALFLVAFFHRNAPGVMARDLMETFGVTGAVIGLLSSTYFYSYAGFMIPGGLLIDAFGARRVVAAGGAVMGLGTLAMGAAGGPALLFAGRFAVGLGATVTFIGTLKIAAAWFPAERFGLLSAVTATVGVLGALIASAPLAALMAVAGWRGAFWTVGAVTLACSLACVAVVRDVPAGAAASPPPALRGLLRGIGRVLANAHTWPVFLSFFCLYSAMGNLFLWAVPFLRDVYGLATTPAATLGAAHGLRLRQRRAAAQVALRRPERRAPRRVGAVPRHARRRSALGGGRPLLRPRSLWRRVRADVADRPRGEPARAGRHRRRRREPRRLPRRRPDPGPPRRRARRALGGGGHRRRRPRLPAGRLPRRLRDLHRSRAGRDAPEPPAARDARPQRVAGAGAGHPRSYLIRTADQWHPDNAPFNAACLEDLSDVVSRDPGARRGRGTQSGRRRPARVGQSRDHHADRARAARGGRPPRPDVVAGAARGALHRAAGRAVRGGVARARGERGGRLRPAARPRPHPARAGAAGRGGGGVRRLPRRGDLRAAAAAGARARAAGPAQPRPRRARGRDARAADGRDVRARGLRPGGGGAPGGADVDGRAPRPRRGRGAGARRHRRAGVPHHALPASAVGGDDGGGRRLLPRADPGRGARRDRRPRSLVQRHGRAAATHRRDQGGVLRHSLARAALAADLGARGRAPAA